MSTDASASTLRPRLYVAVLAHLDTQWQWTVRETAAEFLPQTVLANERLFQEFPSYLLNFEGAHRYRLLADCHPQLFEIVRRRVAEGRWFPSGAAWEAFDSNLPSPESLLRQILLGTRELERLVGRAGRDLFLPDCFGFSRVLPSIAVHCGLVGFSTQKLRRGDVMRSAFGIPFPLGRWIGPDGAELLSALDPGEYGAQTRTDLSQDAGWAERLAAQERGGLPAVLLTYQGLGDRGGAIAPRTAGWLERAATSAGPLEVRIAPSEQLFVDIAAVRASFPAYGGELLLGLHATGCYTSRAQLKALHAATEALAEAAERALALASPFLDEKCLRASSARLRRAWERILTHQMHDDLTGTSLPSAYRHSAADLALSLNELEQELELALANAGEQISVAAEGEPLLLFNPLGAARQEVVALEWPADEESGTPPRLFASPEREVVSQWTKQGSVWRGAALVNSPGLSFTSLALRPGGQPNRGTTAPPRSSAPQLENERYLARLDERGDLSSLFDKRDALELLSAPLRLELLDDRSERFPSWEIRAEDSLAPPRAFVDAPCVPVCVEHGPLRSSLQVDQVAAGSRFRRRYSLSSGGALEVELSIGWRTDATLLKASFCFAWEFEEALFDLGLGVARRPVATARLHEVPAQQWAAAPRPGGGGAVVLSDCRQGWDHPDSRRLRLTILHTPRVGRRFRYQRQQDFGAHRLRFAIAGYGARESLATLAELGARFRQPVRLFALGRAAPAPGNSDWAPIRWSDPAVLLQALKPAEDGDGLILRLREGAGSARAQALTLAAPFTLCEPVDGCERQLSAAEAGERRPLGAFSLLSQRLRSAGGRKSRAGPADHRLPLQRTVHAVGDLGDDALDGGLDGRGCRLPRHLLPKSLRARGIEFDLEPLQRRGSATAARAVGQRLSFPRGMKRLSLLAAAFGSSLEAAFQTSEGDVAALLPDSFAPLGRCDELRRGLPFFGRLRIEKGFLRRAPVRLEIPHRLDAKGRIDPCRPVLLFGIDLAVDPASDWVRLPSSPGWFFFAASASANAVTQARAITPSFRHPIFDSADPPGAKAGSE